jgi:hypothetical protein
MDTKRCAYCHKLQRADAQVCSRCGYVFIQKKTRPFLAEITRPSLLPASPHRVGHYSGLHPEDQPYQSSKIVAQHPSLVDVEERPGAQLPPHEPEQIILPTVKKLAKPVRVVKPVRPPRMETGADSGIDLSVTQPASYNQIAGKMLPQSHLYSSFPPRKPLLNERAIPFILTVSCIIFLLASSILAFSLIDGRAAIGSPALTTSPTIVHVHSAFLLTGSGFGSNDLLTFTHDYNETVFDTHNMPVETHADSSGAFSMQITVPAYWAPGQHQLHVTDEAQKTSVTTTITVQS